MSFTIPTKITVRITARRLNGVVQAPSAIVIGLPSAISYDITSMEAGRVLERTSVIPKGRIVSPVGLQVEIEAALAFDEATLEVLGTEERLFVREGVVFGNCQR